MSEQQAPDINLPEYQQDKPKEWRIEFKANPIQQQFIESRKPAFWAARMGEGKSAGLAWACWYHTRHNPGARWAFIRDTWENLQKTTQKEFFEWFPPGIVGRYFKTEKRFQWTPNSGLRGEVLWLGMDDEADAAKLQSLGLAGFAMDEPAPAAKSGGISKMIFQTAMTRLRQKGMTWYGAKLAANNPDETHWTYETFVQPGTEGHIYFQSSEAENEQNLPESYYKEIEKTFADRPDLIARFVKGDFGFQQIGKSVTPAWNDRLHLARGLEPLDNEPLHLAWDFGTSPACIITQATPLGRWLILEAHAPQDIMFYDFVGDIIRPRLADRFEGMNFDHIGDPAGMHREPTSRAVSAVRFLRRELKGPWRPGPKEISPRINSLNAILSRQMDGRGIVQVDREQAKEVWFALRGGWHYRRQANGTITDKPAKTHPASDVGDAMGYAAAILFPQGSFDARRIQALKVPQARYGFSGGLGFERPGLKIPEHGDPLKGRM